MTLTTIFFQETVWTANISEMFMLWKKFFRHYLQFLLICFSHTQYKTMTSDCSTKMLDLFSTIWYCDWDNDDWFWHSDDAITRQPIYLSSKLSRHKPAEPMNYQTFLLTDTCLKTCERTVDNNQDDFRVILKSFKIAFVG